MIRSGEHAQWAASTVRARALVTLAIYTVVAEHLLVRQNGKGAILEGREIAGLQGTTSAADGIEHLVDEWKDA